MFSPWTGRAGELFPRNWLTASQKTPRSLSFLSAVAQQPNKVAPNSPSASGISIPCSLLPAHTDGQTRIRSDLLPAIRLSRAISSAPGTTRSPAQSAVPCANHLPVSTSCIANSFTHQPRQRCERHIPEESQLSLQAVPAWRSRSPAALCRQRQFAPSTQREGR